MSKANFVPPICGCSDRSGYIRATHKCDECGNICKHCSKSCKSSGHKIRELTKDEVGTSSDWIKAFGYPS